MVYHCLMMSEKYSTVQNTESVIVKIRFLIIDGIKLHFLKLISLL